MALILVADDEPLTLNAYRAKLRDGGHEVCVASRAGQAWEVLHQRHVDLVICDLSMPDGGGVDLIRAIRAWADIPIIVATARPEWHARKLLAGVRIDSFLLKSHFSLRELLDYVNAELGGKAPPPKPAPARPVALAAA